MAATLKPIDGGKSSSAKRHRRQVSFDPADGEARQPLSDFTIPAQDAHGHSAKVITRLTPGLHSIISRIVEKHGKLFGWDSNSDLVRWCVYAGTMRIEEYVKDTEITSMMSLVNSWVAAARVQQEHMKFSASLEVISSTISELMNKGATAPARKIVEEILAQVEDVEDPFWRARFQEDLGGRFGYLLKGNKDKPGPKKKSGKK